MELLTSLKQLPSQPGIYQYFDKNGYLLYIGKAKNLKNRVRSYFKLTPIVGPNSNLSARIHYMITQVASLNTIVVDTEHDALILENSLIKQLKPKYNILMRDDKTYPYIYVDHSEEFPRLEITRKVKKQRSLEYFGPFSSGARELLDAIYETFALVQKKSCLRGKKVCLYYQINKCLAPCEGKVTPEVYKTVLNEAIAHIKEKKKLLPLLQTKMELYANDLRFEEAGNLRDQILAIKKTMFSTTVDVATLDDYDIFSIVHNDNHALFLKLFMRDGKIIDTAYEKLRIPHGFSLDEAYRRQILEFYLNRASLLVKTVLVSDPFEDMEEVATILSQEYSQKVSITNPKRGDKKRLIELAHKNALKLLQEETKKRPTDPLEELVTLCNLSTYPERIEVFDNSHLQGKATVGAMITYDQGKFDKRSYRHYHLETTNEYDQMKETLTKRIESFEKSPPPDLWILDGGEALRLLAISLLESCGTNLDVIAIAKEKVDAKAYRSKGKAHDILYIKNEKLNLKTNDKRLQFVQKLRDEAHRFAITFHKKTKAKMDMQTRLLEKKGIGQAKVQKLINYFGTFEAIYRASEAELSEVLSLKDAKVILAD
jgi:excinuclease ABC subunit C